MEQSIGSNTKPLTPPAAVDPALIPGLTVPVAADGEPEDAARDASPDEAAPDAAVPGDAAPEPEVAAEAESDASADAPAEAEAAEPAPVPDGPVFEAKDFRARIVADHAGVRLSLDDQECDFRWDEIGAVETQTSTFGKRYTVVVHTPDRRWYWIEIDAKSRADVTRWDSELDAVLDTYFEEATEGPSEEAADDAAGDAADGTTGDAAEDLAEDGDTKPKATEA